MKTCWLCKTEVEDKEYTEHIKQCSYNILAECPLWTELKARCHHGYIDCLKDDCDWYQRWYKKCKE
jgi:hypothetical protein